MRPLAEIEVPIAGIGKTLDWAAVLVDIPADACIFFMWQGGATTAAQVMVRPKIFDK
jgi:hypothetical protein